MTACRLMKSFLMRLYFNLTTFHLLCRLVFKLFVQSILLSLKQHEPKISRTAVCMISHFTAAADDDVTQTLQL